MLELKVFVVVYEVEDYHRIEEVFSSKEKAADFIKLNNTSGNLNIEEYELL